MDESFEEMVTTIWVTDPHGRPREAALRWGAGGCTVYKVQGGPLVTLLEPGVYVDGARNVYRAVVHQHMDYLDMDT